MPLNRPTSSQLDTLLATVEEMRQADDLVARLKARATQEAHGLADILDKPTRLAAGVYAYWHAPEVSANDIAFGVTGHAHPAKMMKQAGPVSVGVPCDRCQEDLPIRSRAQMKETQDRLRDGVRWPEGFRVICKTCEADIHEERRAVYEQQDRRRVQRRLELRALPYADYLQTPDWRHVREQHLEALLSMHHSTLVCEVCTSEQGRGVYHKTLDGLGGGDDLVVLCGACRDVLKAAGRIAGEPGNENRLTDSEAVIRLRNHLSEMGFEPADV